MLLELQINCYLGDVWCEWDGLTHGGVDSGVPSWVCFAHTNCHPDKFDTLLSLISTCPNSACSSKLSLKSPSSSKPFLTLTPSLHSPCTLHLSCLPRSSLSPLFHQNKCSQLICSARPYMRPFGADSMSDASFSSPKVLNTVCYSEWAPYSLLLNQLG